MMDTVTKKKRSWIMSRIRSTGTKPERVVSGILRRGRVGFFQHVKELPGNPDFVLCSGKTALFVHGCFFHGCPIHYKAPKSNVDFWVSKVQANMRRDVRSVKALWRRGWHVIRVWEHSLRPRMVKSTTARLLGRIERNRVLTGFTRVRSRRASAKQPGKRHA
jgi:DNA mismatch endonuclease (patch repair protein)